MFRLLGWLSKLPYSAAKPTHWSYLILPCLLVVNLKAQSNSDPYSVKPSAGTALVTPQPPPGSQISNLSNDLYLLHWAEDNLEMLHAGLAVHELNEAIENSMYGRVMRAIDLHLQGLGGVAVGAWRGGLAESPIIEITSEQQRRDIASGRASLVKNSESKDEPVEPLIGRSTDPFDQWQLVVRNVLVREGIPTASLSAAGVGTKGLYDQWREAINRKIAVVEQELATAAKIPPAPPGRSLGLSIDIDSLIQQGIAQQAKSTLTGGKVMPTTTGGAGPSGPTGQPSSMPSVKGAGSTDNLSNVSSQNTRQQTGNAQITKSAGVSPTRAAGIGSIGQPPSLSTLQPPQPSDALTKALNQMTKQDMEASNPYLKRRLNPGLAHNSLQRYTGGLHSGRIGARWRNDRLFST